MSRKHKLRQEFMLERINLDEMPANYLLVILALLKVLTDKFRRDIRKKRPRHKKEREEQEPLDKILLNMYSGLQDELSSLDEKEEEPAEENNLSFIGNILEALQNMALNDTDKAEVEDIEEEEEEISEEEYANLVEEDESTEYRQNYSIKSEFEYDEEDKYESKELIEGKFDYDEEDESKELIEDENDEENINKHSEDKEYENDGIKTNKHKEEITYLMDEAVQTSYNKSIEDGFNKIEDETYEVEENESTNKLIEYQDNDKNEDIQDDYSNEEMKGHQDEKKHELDNSVVISVKNVTVHSSCASERYSEESEDVHECTEPVVSKLPVVLSQVKVEIFVEALTSLPEPAYKITSVDNRIVLKSGHLIMGTDKLFLSGVIQEQVQYATADCVKRESISGEIKHVTVDIPFKCSTKVCFATKPVVPEASAVLELEVLDMETHGISTSEKSYEHFEFLNEKAYCELEGMEILETSIQEDIKKLKKTLPGAYTFEKIRKKIFATLDINILQDQYVFISSFDEETKPNEE